MKLKLRSNSFKRILVYVHADAVHLEIPSRRPLYSRTANSWRIIQLIFSKDVTLAGAGVII